MSSGVVSQRTRITGPAFARSTAASASLQARDWGEAEKDSLQAVGDMLGGGPFDLPRGAWSDDTAMALCLADSELHQGVGFDDHEAVQALIEEHRPDEVAVERVFVHRNPDSALKLGQARGIALLLLAGTGLSTWQASFTQTRPSSTFTG